MHVAQLATEQPRFHLIQHSYLRQLFEIQFYKIEPTDSQILTYLHYVPSTFTTTENRKIGFLLPARTYDRFSCKATS